MVRRSPAAAPLDDLRAKWCARRDEFARFRASVDGATLCDELLAELDSVIQVHDDETLTLRDASTVSGYTVDHLARLIRQGRIPNAGRHGAPRIRVRDIPVRPGRIRRREDDAPSSTRRYDPRTDARSLSNRRLGVSHGQSDTK
jgi:hypothetical protein